MLKAIRKGFKTGLVILAIYLLFVLYLLFVSDRVEKLDNSSNNGTQSVSLTIGK